MIPTDFIQSILLLTQDMVHTTIIFTRTRDGKVHEIHYVQEETTDVKYEIIRLGSEF
jgi:hypothetical protein